MHPILFEIPTPWGSLPVYSYGVMLGTSLIVAWFLIMWLGRTRESFESEIAANAFIVTALTAIAGSRLLYVATNPHELTSFSSLFALRSGGLVAYGGFLGGLIGAAVYLVIVKRSLLAWADLVAPTLGTGLGLTRIGCYLFGCDFGARLSEGAPGWLAGIGTFPSGSPAHQHHVMTQSLPAAASASYAVHPTQLYESLVGFALFGIAMLVWKYRKFRGQVILIVAMLYGAWRFAIEYVRDDPERGFYFGFSTSQLISLFLVPICGLLYFVLRQRPAALAPVSPAPKATEPPKKKQKRKTV